MIKLIRLQVNNLFAFKKADIHFDRYSFCQIKGKKNIESGDNNGAAKSSVPESITWILYGKTGKGIVKDDVIRETKDVCKGRLDLEINGVKYIIIRKRKRGNAERIGFYKVVDGEKENLVIKGFTQEKIIEILGVDTLSYFSSVYFTQDSISKFCSGTNIEITKIIQGIIPQTKLIDDFQKTISVKYKRLNEEYLSFSSEKSVLDKMIEDIDVYELEKEKNKVNNSIMVFAKKIESITIELNGISNKIKIIENINKYRQQYKSLKNECLNRMMEYKSSIERNEKAIAEVNSKSAESGDLEKLDKLRVKTKLLLNGCEIERDKKNVVIEKLSSDIAVLAKQVINIKRRLGIGKWSDNPTNVGVRCEVCFMKLDDSGCEKLSKYGNKLEKEANEKLKLHSELKKELDKLNNEIKELREKDNEIENKQFRIRQSYTDKKIVLEKLNNEIAFYSDKAKTLKEGFKIDKKRLKHELKSFKRRLENYKNVNETRFDELSSISENSNKKIDELQRLLIELISKIQFFEKNREQYQKIKDNYDRVFNELKICEYWQTNIPKLKVYLTAAILPDLNEGIKKRLQYLKYNFDVSYKVGKERKSGKIVDEFSIDIVNLTTGYKRGWDSLSGSEKQRIALATFFSLNNISDFGFMFLDEVLRGFDSVGRRLALELLCKESNDGKQIFVIDHLDDIESYFREKIVVKNTNEVAEVQA